MRYAFEQKKQLDLEVFSNDPGLTEEQRNYELKFTPAHYRPTLAAKKLAHFEKALGIKANESTAKEVYCIASFNDWMPMRMKTALMLRLERYPLNYDVSDIPQ